MNFKRWLLTEISNNTILYHRSSEHLSQGQILEPYGSRKEDHWLKGQYTEKMLEKFREKYAPDKPSRFNCIFSSVVPRSVFLTKGYLYEVKPMGKIHSTLAYYINEINNIYNNEISYSYMASIIGDKASKQQEEKFKWEYNKERLLELFNKYWGVDIDITTWEDDGLKRPLKPVNPIFKKDYEGEIHQNFRKDPKWIEVLCEKVQVVGRVYEKEKKDVFRMNDRVEFIDNIKNNFYGYDSSGNAKLSEQAKNRIIKDFNGEKDKYGGYVLNINKGIKGVILNSSYSQPIPRKFMHRLPYDYTYGKSIYNNIRVKPDGYDFSINLSSINHKNMHNIIKKI